MAHQGLVGRRLLVVEDNFVMAHEISCLLQAHGSIVLGPASTTAQAFSFLRRGSPDGALLDVKLGNGTCEALAAAVRQSGIPMLLVTAIDRSSIPLALTNERYLAKPFQAPQLIAAASSLLAERSSHLSQAEARVGSRRKISPRFYAAHDLEKARLQVERAARLVAEQRACTARLSAKGLDTRQAISLLRIMLNLLEQMERRRDHIAAALLLDDDGSAPAH